MCGAKWGFRGHQCRELHFYECSALCDIADCITKHAVLSAPVERQGGDLRGAPPPCVFHLCVSVSQGKDGGWSGGSSMFRVPGSGRKMGGTEEWEGSRDSTRDAVSSLERG